MKAAAKGLVLTIVLSALLGAEVAAGRMLRDFSGDAMQSYDSRMMDSPMTSFPGLFGISLWPHIAYPPVHSMTNVIVQIQFPELNRPPMPPPASAVRPKFWTDRCGIFVELEVNSTMQLIEEERKPCSP
jgi:hypothetical protein